MSFLNFISIPLFEHLRKRGILVFYWVLNDPDDYRRAVQVHLFLHLGCLCWDFKAGVTGIMTDSPTLLHEYLNKTRNYLKNE